MSSMLSFRVPTMMKKPKRKMHLVSYLKYAFIVLQFMVQQNYIIEL